MSNTGMLQRCWEHDYSAPCFYMITVVTEPRRECLSVLSDPEAGAASGTGQAGAASGIPAEPCLRLLPAGEVVRDVWRRTAEIYPGVEACECVVMPDHFHGILRVKRRLARHMGHIVKAFKRVSEQECRSNGLLWGPELKPDPEAGAASGTGQAGAASGTEPAAPACCVPAAASAAGLWQAGFQDSILMRRGQLKAMANYIADNPRRLAAKRANPALFTVVAHEPVLPGKHCAFIGNRFLLRHPLKRRIQVSRRISPPELALLQEELLYSASHGAVLVSPCISPGEKAIARAAMDAGHPLVVLFANGFAPHYKPPGRYFDACAAGRLLILAPFPYERKRHAITREQCLELNSWAREIEELDQSA